MSPDSACLAVRIAPSVWGQCRRAFWIAAGLLAVVLGGLATPSVALAHGPVNPAASSFLATVGSHPPGMRPVVVDGDQRLWLHVDPRITAIIIDNRGAPYLRFSTRGVAVNRNSAMYYPNQVPVQQAPANLGPATRPAWSMVSSGHGYSWHDGRLHALAATALTPGSSYVGTWRIPVRVNGHPAAITGVLRHAADPSLVWFWPIIVALACILAALRVRDTGLDRRVARTLAAMAILAFGTAGIGEELHGRPGVSPWQYVMLAAILAFVVWGLRRVVRGPYGWFGYFVIAVAAVWQGASLVGVLTQGFVLIALPVAVARIAVVACLAAGAGLLPVIFRLAELPERGRVAPPEGATGWDEEEWDDGL
jgi:hypothetical protein